MIRYKKIRGHKRIWKDIDQWVLYNKVLDIEYLQQRQRGYVKVWVQPFSNISILNSEFSPPKGKTRQRIINGIFIIYQSWKVQLDTLEEPYYLKIWYYPHNISRCQVVCATGEHINFYDNTFYKPQELKSFPENTRGLEWEYKHQEHHLTMDDIGEVDDFMSERDFLDNKKYVESVMKKPKTRVTHYELDNAKKETYYSIKDCDVWIGG